jgi:hypothetical protein
MDLNNSDSQATEKKLSEQFAEFIDLADEDLEEVEVLEFGGIHGGYCGGCGHYGGCGGCGHYGGCGGCGHYGGCGGCGHYGGCGGC